MKFDKNQDLWNFFYFCMVKKITFTDQDFYNYAKACHLKVDMKYALDNFFLNGATKSLCGNETEFIATKSILGPCYIHPTDVNPKNVKYNISKIIKDLNLANQRISSEEKLKKITDYIELLG
jgi:hypothetical protein